MSCYVLDESEDDDFDEDDDRFDEDDPDNEDDDEDEDEDDDDGEETWQVGVPLKVSLCLTSAKETA